MLKHALFPRFQQYFEKHSSIHHQNNVTMNELESIKGSGRSWRVTKKDILFYLKSDGGPSEKLNEIKFSSS